ncbi:M28 Zn-peptidase nicastrin [Trifolium repens]|nr:M28 Zn-peptidase nicastrin [Trifolium repens]
MRNCKDEKCVHLRAKLASIKGKDDIWSVQRGKTEQWLQSFDQRLRESIDYAICLDSIGSWENEPWIHVSKPPENAFIKQIMEDFSSVAEDLGLQVNLKHKKINISNSREAGEGGARACAKAGRAVAPPMVIRLCVVFWR